MSATPPPCDYPKKVPLKRIESIREKKMRQGLWTKYLSSKPRWSSRWKSSRESNVNLIKRNFDDVCPLIYVAEIQIGTPSQNLTVLMDTGSSDLWVTGTKCNNADCSHVYCKIPFLCRWFCDKSCCEGKNEDNPCANKHKFDVQASRSFKRMRKRFGLKYETGSCSGFVGTDRIGGICVQNQVLGVADKLASFFTELPADGICGLGFAPLSAMDAIPPVQRMINQKLLEQPIFTIWMKQTDYYQTVGGQLTLGGFDSDHCSSTCRWVPLTKASYWEFYIDSVSIAPTMTSPQIVISTSMSNNKIKAISDTGTYLIFGPQDEVKRLAYSLGAKYDQENELTDHKEILPWYIYPFQYVVPCYYAYILPSVVVTIRGNAYPITAQTYVIPTPEGKCMLGFLGREYNSSLDSGPAWILGDCWIRQYCQVYDMWNKRIGFCRSL
ncbi:unnamed protein product [Soboliphyme baturini]|uniref:Peptidase A1 domain-containing protein n=1 Tax=Soboliphyme baturini TaxID=241478 RepID=A0A183IV75_9BILA|nr:unnamed protein product [Soboliphyme baturini]